MRAGSLALTYSHGESLIRRDFFDIVRIFAERGFHQTLMNNGFYVRSPDEAQRLREAGIGKALVSLDHIEPDVHNAHRGNRRAFDVAMTAVNYMRDAGIPRLGFSVAMDTHNYAAIPDIARLAIDMGLTDLSLMQTRYMDGHGFSTRYVAQYKEACRQIYELIVSHSDELDIYTHDPFMLSQMDHRILSDRTKYESYVGANVCNVGTNMVSIDPTGNVTGCNFLRKRFGNVREEPFIEIWKRLVEYYEPVKQPTSGSCTRCSLASSCSSGCLAFHEDPNEFDARCSTDPFPAIRPAGAVPPDTPARKPGPRQPDGPVFLTLTPRRLA